MEDGWIEWKGGECPVAPETTVECRFQPSYHGEDARDTLRADEFRWDHKWNLGEPSWGNIIAYRIAPQAVSAS